MVTFGLRATGLRAIGLLPAASEACLARSNAEVSALFTLGSASMHAPAQGEKNGRHGLSRGAETLTGSARRPPLGCLTGQCTHSRARSSWYSRAYSSRAASRGACALGTGLGLGLGSKQLGAGLELGTGAPVGVRVRNRVRVGVRVRVGGS